MRKKYLWTAAIIMVCLFCINAEMLFAQPDLIDSLLARVKSDKPACESPCIGDSSRIDHLHDLSWELKYIDPDTAIIVCNEALHLSEKIKMPDGSTGWKRGIGESLHQMGGLSWLKGENAEALEYFGKALDIWEELIAHEDKNVTAEEHRKLLSRRSATVGNMGNVYMHQGDLPGALGYYLKALKMDEELENKQGITRHLGNIGAVYAELKDYPKALDYYFRAMKIDEELGYKNGLAKSMGNIGAVYMEQGDYPKALEYYFKAQKIDEEINDFNGLSGMLDKIGNVYASQKMFDKAREYYFQALKIAEQAGDVTSTINTLANLGTSYADTKQYSEGIKCLLKSLALADTLGLMQFSLNANQNLYTIYERIGDYKKAFHHFQAATTLRDSIFNIEKNNEITSKALNYEFEKKTAAAKAEQDKKDALATAEIQRQRLIKNIILLGIGIAGILIFLAVRSSNKRKKLSFEKSVSEIETKALRSQMNPHFIANSLQSINKYIIENEKENASEYLARFAKLMRLILENSREAEVPMEKDLRALELYLELESLRFKNRFKYKIEVAKDIDPANTLVPPMLLQPFVENSILHGLRTREDGLITIKIDREDSMIRCSVEDNGIGRQQSVTLETGQEKRESLGMKITMERLSVINHLKKAKAAVNIIDLKGNENLPQGVRVELLLPYEKAF